MVGDLIGAAVGFVLAIAIVYTRRGEHVSYAVMLTALLFAALSDGAMNVIALLAAFCAGYGYRVERQRVKEGRR